VLPKQVLRKWSRKWVVTTAQKYTKTVFDSTPDEEWIIKNVCISFTLSKFPAVQLSIEPGGNIGGVAVPDVNGNNNYRWDGELLVPAHAKITLYAKTNVANDDIFLQFTFEVIS